MPANPANSANSAIDSTEGQPTMTESTMPELPQYAALRAAIEANVPVLLMGAPGTAKTATLEAIAAERGAHIEIVIASAQDPTTILGIPMPSEDRKYTMPTTPGWAARINAADAAGKPTILFLDELTTVPEMVAGPLLGVVQSRRADGWTLPADTRIVAAANPPDLAVGGWAVAPAMANRWVHIRWDAPHAQWTAWARQQASPALRGIADFIDTMPDILLDVPKSINDRSGAWPSPRSWTNAAALIDASNDNSLAALAVGQSAAALYQHWASARDVPSVADMLSGAAALPTRQDAFVQALKALADAATPDTSERTLDIFINDAIPVDAAVVRSVAPAYARNAGAAGIARLGAALDAAGVAL